MVLFPRKALVIRLALFGAVFALILGAKLRMIERYGSDLPYWDQWDAEGDNLYRPYLEKQLAAAALFQPHNEHRIFFTRVFALGLFEANDRQWDARVQLVANAVLHAGIALLLLALALRVLPALPAGAFAGVAVLFFGMDVSWENTLSGLQATFYFLLLFSVLHLGGTLLARPRSLGWWLAPLAGLATLFSMGSGLLSALALLSVTGLRVVRDRKLTREDAFVLAANAAIATAGWLLKTDVPGHAMLKAPNFLVWLDAWTHQLAWPMTATGTAWYAPLGLVPPLALLAAYVRRKIDGPLALTLLGASTWTLLQTMAIAYARGATEQGYSSRYTDTLALGVLLNLLSLAYLTTQARAPRRRRLGLALTTLFTLICLWGLRRESVSSYDGILRHLPEVNAARIAAVRGYLFNRDPAFFTKTPWNELPYPSVDRLAKLLDSSILRPLLPASVRPPVSLAAEPDRTQGFHNYSPSSSPGAPPLGLAAWSSRSNESARFITGSFSVEHSRVTLYVAGEGTGPSRLRLVDENLHAHDPLGSLTVGPRWKRLNFAVPPGRYRLEATHDGAGWFAFTQPSTNTLVSNLALKTVRWGYWLLGTGIGLALIVLILLWPEKSSTALPPLKPRWQDRFYPQVLPWGAVVLAILFARRPEMFLHPQLWAEDGPIFFLQADTYGLGALQTPYGGYHLLLLRLIAAAAAPLDALWIPTAYLIASLATVFALGAAIFSPRIDLPRRAACFVAIALLPHTGEVFGNLANLQWLSALGLVWLLLARDAATPRQSASDALLAVVVGLTGIFSILLTPLFVWRAWRRKSRSSALLAVLVALIASVQAWTVLHSPATPAGIEDFTVGSAAWFTGYRLTASLFLPPAWAEHLPRAALIALGLAAIGALLVCALAPGSRREFRLLIVACLVAVIMATIFRARYQLGAFAGLHNGDRYLFIPKLLTVWLLICGWSGPKWIRWSTGAACGLAFLATLAAWRYETLKDHHWAQYARRIQAGEAVTSIPINPGMTFDHPGRH